MNRSLLLFSAFLLLTAASMAQVQLKFVTQNKYGNNLYLDNITVGTPYATDAAVVSINNIAPDTGYVIGTTPFQIAPRITIANIGINAISTSFQAVLTATGYTSTKTVTSLTAASSVEVVFDPITITPGQPLNLLASVNVTGDLNPVNNTLTQYSLMLPGAARKVLFEEYTSSTCGPCAANNPTIDAFVTAKFDSVVAIKYHMNWPAPGNDPMYHYNPTQNTERRNYYGVNSVPALKVDGVVDPVYPYTTAGSLDNALGSRVRKGTPLALSVTDTRIGSDSIRATITIQVLAPVPAGNYYLRLSAIERKIEYASAPGSNGERIFSDVFRKAFPSTQGTVVPTTLGNHTITITYPIDKTVWVDSMIYSAVFIQNDVTKEVMNAAKARNHVDGFENLASGTPVLFPGKPVPADILINDAPKALYGSMNPEFFYYSLFEGTFPPQGWTVKNPDNGITFEKYVGVNGPTYAGTNAVTLRFYDYSTSNQTDTLITPVFGWLTPTDSIRFDYAYAMYSATYPDRLTVLLSTDHGATFPTTIFDKSGSDLATAATTTNSFAPTSPSQWKRFSFPLPSSVPVELISLTASATGNSVTLRWATATETNNQGFEVLRSTGEGYQTVGFVKGNGTATSISEYAYTDASVPAGSYTYRLKQIDHDGSYRLYEPVSVDVTGNLSFALVQNYPNPFNPSTKINFTLPADAKVTLKVFSISGEEAAVLIDKNLSAGSHTAVFDAASLPAGVYLCRLTATDNTGAVQNQIIKMTYLK